MTGIAEHGDRLADVEDLLEVVGDVEEGDTGGLHLADLAEQPGDGLSVELGGRLVEHDEPRAAGHGASDLDELALLDGQLTGHRCRIDVHAERLEYGAGATAHRPPRDEPMVGVEEEVLGDRQRADDGRALVHAGDEPAPALGTAERWRGLAVEADLAGVGGV